MGDLFNKNEHDDELVPFKIWGTDYYVPIDECLAIHGVEFRPKKNFYYKVSARELSNKKLVSLLFRW
ncbi:uncharacterized protein G2W53_008770 [Senna tora]|uniref:Uncharacterized protein n=1 Tax=Senna tora TaxID=362788 RepID=A0A835C979_9FABA|nr:uncharacterized protein G2W53_008770 [Senna tora]